jgi:hypothetical protein
MARKTMRNDQEDQAVIEVFVFGSNLAGRHGKGAALYAKQHHGAIYGQGEGLQGNSYAIPTKDEHIRVRPLEAIAGSIATFLEVARSRPDLTFNVTPVGCGLAGYRQEQIKPLFGEWPDNCRFSKEWEI